MRCKAGDLAIRTVAPTRAGIPVGSIVEVIEFCGTACSTPLGGGFSRERTDFWNVRFRGSDLSPNGLEWAIPDCELQPIRDQPGADESLSWAQVPTTKPLIEEEFKAAEVKWGERV